MQQYNNGYQYYNQNQPNFPPQQYEKNSYTKTEEYRNLRRHSIGVGLCLIAYFVIQQVILAGLSITGLSKEYLNNPSFQYAFGAVFFSAVALWIPFFIKSLRKGNPGYIGVLPFEPPKKKYVGFCCVFAGLAICLCANYLAGIVGQFLNGIGVEQIETPTVKSVSAMDTLLNILCTAVVPALAEEFVFRGVIMQPLRRYGDHFAVIATALIFGLAHGSPTNFVFAFVAGLAMGYAVVISGSLWAGIIVHLLNNFLAVAVTEIYNYFPNLSTAPYQFVIGAFIVLGLICAAVLVILRPYSFSTDESRLRSGGKVRGLFLSIPMLLSIAVLLYYISLSIK